MHEWPWSKMGFHPSLRDTTRLSFPHYFSLIYNTPTPGYTIAAENKNTNTNCSRPARLVHHGGPSARPQPRLQSGGTITPFNCRRCHAPYSALGILSAGRHTMAPDTTRPRQTLERHPTARQSCETGRLAPKPHRHHHPPAQDTLGDTIARTQQHPRGTHRAIHTSTDT